MKTLALCVIVGFTCMAVHTTAWAQASSGRGKPSTDAPPREVCQAIEAYIGNIDAAKSKADPSKRAETYAEANRALESVLQKYNRTSLLAEATQYATYAEQVLLRDATDPQLPELLDKRLKVRAGLLELCAGYTITR